jgi:hypothetical protein
MSQRLSVSVAAFTLQMRRLHASGDLSPSNHIHQCMDRALTRSKHPPKCLLHSAGLPCGRHERRVVLASQPQSRFGVGIKSP